MSLRHHPTLQVIKTSQDGLYLKLAAQVKQRSFLTRIRPMTSLPVLESRLPQARNRLSLAISVLPVVQIRTRPGHSRTWCRAEHKLNFITRSSDFCIVCVWMLAPIIYCLNILSYYLIIGFNYVQSLRQGAGKLLPVMIYHQIFDVVNEAAD